MTLSQKHLLTIGNLISISAQWSNGYLIPGQTNNGNLSISSTNSPPAPITIEPGDQIILEIREGNWLLVATDKINWLTKNLSVSAQSKFCLIYQGAAEIVIPPLTLQLVTGTGDTPPGSNTSLTLNIDITPPSSAKAPNITIQVCKADSSPVSYPYNSATNYVEPGVPLAAFAANPAVVLLTGENTINFPNEIMCRLLNQSGTSISSASLMLALKAWDQQQNQVPITQNLGDVTVAGDLSWQYDSAANNWSAALGTGIEDKGMLKIAISNLVLLYSDVLIDTLEAVLTISGAGGHAPYQTSGRFQAYGPYELVIALDEQEPGARFYRLNGDSGTYDINPLNPGLNQPPLAPELVDLNDNVVYPPVAGWFSWDKTKPRFSSSHELQPGDNPLYFLVENADDGYQPLTNSTADYNFYPQEIYAAGFNQSYGDKENPSFGLVMPAGVIVMWSGTAAPDGWALCDGAASPNPNITIPDLRGQFIVGFDSRTPDYSKIGSQGGSAQITLNTDQIPAHTHDITHGHSITDPGHKHSIPLSSNTNCCNMAPNGNDSKKTGYTAPTNQTTTGITVNTFSGTSGSSGNSGAHENRPPYYTLAFIIKL